MAYLISASYALFAIVASGAGLVYDETSMPQLPPGASNPAFVEQLPETVVVPTTPPTPSRPVTQKKVRQANPKHVVTFHSIFPSIGAGVNARTDPAPTDSRLPTVGGGVGQSL
jgi:hypothetical protein